MATRLDAAGAYLVLDEAFVDFVEEASFKASLDRFPRLMILRSFTKFFGIPGMLAGSSYELLAGCAARIQTENQRIFWVESISPLGE